jgi:hypothetical protein
MRNRTRITLAVLAVMFTVGAAPAAGITHTSKPDVRATDVERADALYAEAEALLSQPRQWRRAVRLFERSAELRPASDPAGYAALQLAGQLRASFRDYNGARATLERAGDHALARGAVLDAARAYIDAAYAASHARQNGDAHALLGRAALLAESPLLTDEQRFLITRRLPA